MTSNEILERIDNKNYLTEREHKEYLNILEKDLKLLDLIIKKKVDISMIIYFFDYKDYFNYLCSRDGSPNDLNEDEFNLLRDKLKDYWHIFR